jgi:uncharacterized protein involved in type VI secretion and phage assembly
MFEAIEAILRLLEGRFYGKYRGIVTENDPGKDPDGLGRIKVKVSAVLKDMEVWAMPCVPYAGDGAGFVFIPDKDANVWVEFEGGDPSYPIWTGCFWKSKELETITNDPSIKLIKTKKMTIEIDDEKGAIKIENNNGTVFEINGNKITNTANQEIVSQVKTMKTKIDVTKVDVNDGAMSVT